MSARRGRSPRLAALGAVGLVGAIAVGVLARAVPGTASAAALTASAVAVAVLAASGARGAGRAALLMPAALGAFGLGCVVHTFRLATGSEVLEIAPADVVWWVAYALFAAAVTAHVRPNVRGRDAGLWLDAAITAAGVAALALVVFDELLDRAGADPTTLLANLAFPACGFALLVVVVASMALSRAPLVGPSGLLAAAALVLAVSDVAYLLRVADGVAELGAGPTDALYPVALALLAAGHLTAVAGARPTPARPGARMPVVPLIACVAVVVLLVADHVERLGHAPVVLAAVVLLLALVRMVLAFETIAALRETEHEARTDELTGLGNRRALRRDLAAATAAPDARSTLALFDLDGFKHYNDAFGHPAGDALLARMGVRLRAAVAGHGAAFRLGGDEFCVLVTTTEVEHALVVAAALEALGEEGEDVRVGASHGTVVLPDEAADADAALGLVDVRMYATKEARRPSTRVQTRDVLLNVLREQQPDLEEHSGDVGHLVEAVGRRLGLDAEGLDQALHAAELHDVGKVAIPPAILGKPSALDDDEWAVMRRHTVIGERILAAVPALVPVARLVRASHERWDGGGYPDGLRGEEIPLAARVIAVCDAFHAMTTDRAYRRARPVGEALAELERCAGTQFDPLVVAAFAAELSAAGPGPATAPPALAPSPPSALAPAGAVASAAAQELATLSKLRGLLEVSRLARSGATAEALLAETCRTITTTLGFRCAVANLVRPGTDETEVVAVVGDEAARAALLGTRNAVCSWDELLDERFERQGAWFVRLEDWPIAFDAYVPARRRPDEPDAWQPEDALFVPLTAADGERLGVISVDEPLWGRRPTDDELEVLVAVVGHAALALDVSRARAAAAALWPAG